LGFWKGASSVKEFYAKNHKWSEGLVTAAKLVGLGANVLIEKTDKFVNGNGKLEEIIVSSNEIAASTAQLVVASNVTFLGAKSIKLTNQLTNYP
jgi:hypothetical protein